MITILLVFNLRDLYLGYWVPGLDWPLSHGTGAPIRRTQAPLWKKWNVVSVKSRYGSSASAESKNCSVPLPLYAVVNLFTDECGREERHRTTSGCCICSRRDVRTRHRKRLRRKCHGGLRSRDRHYAQLQTRRSRSIVYLLVSLSRPLGCSLLIFCYYLLSLVWYFTVPNRVMVQQCHCQYRPRSILTSGCHGVA